MTEVHSPDAPAPVGPYSQAFSAGGFLFLSGQLGIDPESGDLLDGVEGQTRQALENIRSILAASGLELSSVVRAGIYMSDMNDFARMNEVYETFFERPFPARAAAEVSGLPLGALVEIDVIACHGPPAVMDEADGKERDTW